MVIERGRLIMRKTVLGLILVWVIFNSTALASDVPGWLRVNDGSNTSEQSEPGFSSGNAVQNADAVWESIPAVLNQKMATRTGPSTAYTEDLGTHSQETTIVVFQQEMGSGVPWALVEFEYRGGLYRAYTGMKRIDISSVPPWADQPQVTTIVNSATLYYGPGAKYVPLTYTLQIGTKVEVYGNEQGYALIDYISPSVSDKRVRSWISLSALQGYNP